MMLSTAGQKPSPDFSDTRLWQNLSECPLCGHDAFRLVVRAQDRHYGNPGVFPIVECDACHVWFLNPMPTIHYLSGAYPDNYYSYSLKQPSRPNPSAKKAKRLLRQIVRFTSGWTRDPKFKTPGKMLDIGCGAGAFLLEMKRKGWSVRGVELDATAAERGRNEGLDIFGGTIDEARLPDASFDYIRSNHSFEHIHNPREVLREIRRIIKPDGKLFIGVPNVKGLMSKVYGTYWWYLGAPVHTFGYCPETIKALLAQEGFRVIKVNYNSTFGGTFGSLQILVNSNSKRSSEEGWIYNNWGMRLLGHWLARAFDIVRMGDCMEVIAVPSSSPANKD